MCDAGPGKAFREGMPLMDHFKRLPDDAAADAWFVEQRWPKVVQYPDFGSTKVNPRRSI